MSKKFMVLDVEGYSTCKPYDVGFLVTDKTGTVYEEHSVGILPACWDNLNEKYKKQAVKGLATANEMAHKNIHEIMTETNGKYLIIRDIEKFFVAFISVIKKYDIKRIWSYSSFDKKALLRLFGESNFAILESMVTFCDIIPAITYTKLLDKSYITFCNDNGYITKAGNVKTTAEIVYRFLTGISGFSEEHTGLADARIEKEILLFAMRATKTPKYKPIQAWRVIKKFCEIEGLEISYPDFNDLVE